MEGKIAIHPISILIDTTSNHNYVTPEIIENCGLKRERNEKIWWV